MRAKWHIVPNDRRDRCTALSSICLFTGSVTHRRPAGRTMFNRAIEFLDCWESENVETVADSEKVREAKRLASLCRSCGGSLSKT
jgi:hypothetical protein